MDIFGQVVVRFQESSTLTKDDCNKYPVVPSYLGSALSTTVPGHVILRLSAVCVAVEIGLLRSLVLSTSPNQTSLLVKVMVPVYQFTDNT